MKINAKSKMKINAKSKMKINAKSKMKIRPLNMENTAYSIHNRVGLFFY